MYKCNRCVNGYIPNCLVDGGVCYQCGGKMWLTYDPTKRKSWSKQAQKGKLEKLYQIQDKQHEVWMQNYNERRKIIESVCGKLAIDLFECFRATDQEEMMKSNDLVSFTKQMIEKYKEEMQEESPKKFQERYQEYLALNDMIIIVK